MTNNDALTADEVAEILHIGRNAVYALAKEGALASYRIGRRLRFTYDDVQSYIALTRGRPKAEQTTSTQAIVPEAREDLVLCGQDIILDVLSNYIAQAGVRCLRSYVGSYDALTALYKDEVQVASAHLWDGDSGTYNIPYVKRLLPGVPVVVVHLTCRTQGFYVAKGNPKGIEGWGGLGPRRRRHGQPREGGGQPRAARRAPANPGRGFRSDQRIPQRGAVAYRRRERHRQRPGGCRRGKRESGAASRRHRFRPPAG